MMSMINGRDVDLREYVKRAVQTKYGTTYAMPDYTPMRIDHKGCTAGDDSRQRLYIERKSNEGADTIVYFCHNCGLGGGLSSRGMEIPNYRRRTDSEFTECEDQSAMRGPSIGGYLPDRFGVQLMEEWSNEARVWLMLYHRAFTRANHAAKIEQHLQSVVTRYGILFKPYENKIVFPTYDLPGGDGLVGWQERRLTGMGPKYITYRMDKSVGHTGSYVKTIAKTGTLVLTEDYISACAVANSGQGNALALMGTHIDAERLLQLATIHDKIIVWLDNDNETVDKHSSTIVRKLKMFGRCEVGAVLAPYSDPKHYSVQGICDIIGGVYVD